jgi:hypothetical protein
VIEASLLLVLITGVSNFIKFDKYFSPSPGGEGVRGVRYVPKGKEVTQVRYLLNIL